MGVEKEGPKFSNCFLDLALLLNSDFLSENEFSTGIGNSLKKHKFLKTIDEKNKLSENTSASQFINDPIPEIVR